MSPVWGRGRGDRDAVLAGMEMMRWSYRDDEWQQLVDAYRTAPAARRGADSAGIALVGGALGAIFGTIVGPAGTIGGAAFGATTLWLVPGLLERSRHNQAARVMAALGSPEVVVTSHGLLAGDLARLWRGPDYWLSNVWLFRTGPLILELIFASRYHPFERIKLPIPEPLESDVTEMARLLENKVPHQRDDEPPPAESCRPGPGPKVC